MWRELLRLADAWSNLIEVGVLFALIYLLLTFLRGTRGEGMLKFAFVLGVGFVLLRGVVTDYQLKRLLVVFDAMFQASVVAIVVVFQPELRRLLALRIGERWFNASVPEQQVVEEVVSACMQMSQKRIGALVVFEREDSLRNYLSQPGTLLDAQVSAELLLTIFFPGTRLHDMAVIIQNGRIAGAGCILPVSDNPALPKSLGTRHRAALGLSEAEDALCVVVSEETGTVSLAVGGQLHRELDQKGLLELLQTLYLNPRTNRTAALSGPAAPADAGKSTTRIKRKIATSS